LPSDAQFYAGYVCIALFLTMLGAIEIGFRIGRRHTLGERTLSVLGVLQGALLGTVALLLGFTFSMASSRYDARRILMAEEANAIGTTYLRTTLASPDNGVEMRRLLRDYLGQRIAWLHARGDPTKVAAASESLQKLQIGLWMRVRNEAAKDPQSEMTALLVESVNQTIDLESMQRAVRYARVPQSSLLLVVISSILTALTLGYGFGVAKERVIAGSLGFCALVSAIAFTIVDFDRPDRGLIRVSEAVLDSLHERIVRAVEREREGGLR
jgi:hypothetical protein